MRNKKLGDLTISDMVKLSALWYLFKPVFRDIDNRAARALREWGDRRQEKFDQKKAKDGPEVEAEKIDLLQTLQVPCDRCGEVLCDGFCHEREAS